MIFAAGLGTRLKPLTDTLPKALVPLAGKTLLQWQVERLKAAGITDIVMNVHHFADKIIDYLRENDNFGCNIQVSDERDMLLETGGGLRKAQPLLSSSPLTSLPNSLITSSPILACNVDILSNIDIPALLRAYNPEEMGLVVVMPRDTQRYLVFDDAQRLYGWTNIATGEVRGPISNSQYPQPRFLRHAGAQSTYFQLYGRVGSAQGREILFDRPLCAYSRKRSSQGLYPRELSYDGCG